MRAVRLANPKKYHYCSNLAFRFNGDDSMIVPANPRLDVVRITMSAWIRPVEYDIMDQGDRGIIMNKENAYEMGLQDETGALQGAFSPCFRWFGETRIPNHEWTHVAMAYDGTSELHYVHGVHQETDPCGDPGGSMTASQYPLRIGAREAAETSFCESGEGCSAFQGDIDELMLFNRALSELEISGLQSANYRTGGGMINVYAAGDADPSRLPDGCVGFWPLDGNRAL